MTTLYGIKNCDTVKKARKWLEHQGVDYQFHDFRQDGIDASLIKSWLKTLDWETLVNKRSTTWKQLDETTRNSLSDKTVVEILVQNPTLIKRPVTVIDKDHVAVGFSEGNFSQLFNR